MPQMREAPSWRVKAYAFMWNKNLAFVAGPNLRPSHPRVECLTPKHPKGGTKPWSYVFP